MVVDLGGFRLDQVQGNALRRTRSHARQFGQRSSQRDNGFRQRHDAGYNRLRSRRRPRYLIRVNRLFLPSALAGEGA